MCDFVVVIVDLEDGCQNTKHFNEYVVRRYLSNQYYEEAK